MSRSCDFTSSGSRLVGLVIFGILLVCAVTDCGYGSVTAAPAAIMGKPFQVDCISLVFLDRSGPQAQPISTIIGQIQSLGVNTVKLTISGGYYDSPTDNLPDTSVYTNPPDTELVSMMTQLKAAGIAVILNPFTDINISTQNVLDNVSAKPKDFNVWIAAHTAFMVQLAKDAEQAGAYGFLVLGDEVQDLTQNPANETGWLNMIAAIRSVFSGKLLCELATTGGTTYVDGTLNNIPLTPPSIINALDVLGVGWSPFPLTDVNDPTMYQLLEAWNESQIGVNTVKFLHNLSVKYNKPVLIEDVAFHSYSGDNINPLQIYNAAIPLVANQQDQANEYESLIMVMSENAGNWFQGICFDSWNNYPADYLAPLRFQSSPWGENIRGKLAEKTLTKWNHTAVSVATDNVPLVSGNSATVNFLSAGDASSATLMGGNLGDTFIAGPGKTTIIGGAGDDTIYARPANWIQENTLDITLTPSAINVASPSLTVFVNGTPAISALLLAAGGAGPTRKISIDVSRFGNISSLKIMGAATAIDASHFSNIIIDAINYNGYSIPLPDGKWSNNLQKPGLLNNNDTAVFSASSFQLLPPPFTMTATDFIDGGGGVNTVVYRGRLSDYTLHSNDDGSTIVSSATGEGPDRLVNIQFVQFSDRNVALSLSAIPFGIPTGGVASASSSGNLSVAKSGYSVVQANSGNPIPYGTAVFSLTQNGVVVSEVGVPASGLTTSARIFIDYRSQVAVAPGQSAGRIDIDTGLAVVNTNAAVASVSYTLRGIDGKVIATGHGTIGAGAHFARFIEQLRDVAPDFTLPVDFALSTGFASLDITSDRALSVLALRLTVNQRGETVFTTTPTADLNQPLSKAALYFPQFADGGGYTNTILLMNTSAAAETGRFGFFDDNGVPVSITATDRTVGSSFAYAIPAGGVFVFQTDGSPATVKVGSIRLTPDSGTSTPIGSGVFRFTSGGVVVTESGIPAASLTTHARIYVDKSGGHDTGIAIADSSGAGVDLTVQAFEKDGTTPVAGSQTFTLKANGHKAAFVSEFIQGLPDGFTGVLDISSSNTTPAKSFAALTLRSLVNSRGDSLLTTLPVADVTQPAPGPVVFPQIVDGGGYTTQFILLSTTGQATVTVTSYGDTTKW